MIHMTEEEEREFILSQCDKGLHTTRVVARERQVRAGVHVGPSTVHDMMLATECCDRLFSPTQDTPSRTTQVVEVEVDKRKLEALRSG